MFQLRRVCYGSSEPSPVWSCSDDINFLSLLAILKMYVTRHEGPKFVFNMCVYIYIYIYIYMYLCNSAHFVNPYLWSVLLCEVSFSVYP